MATTHVQWSGFTFHLLSPLRAKYRQIIHSELNQRCVTIDWHIFSTKVLFPMGDVEPIKLPWAHTSLPKVADENWFKCFCTAPAPYAQHTQTCIVHYTWHLWQRATSTHFMCTVWLKNI